MQPARIKLHAKEHTNKTTPSRDLTLGGKEQKRKPQKTISPHGLESPARKTDLRGTRRWRFCHRWVRALNPYG